jgi:hypothetical protein
MKAGTLLYHGADLALYGRPRFTLRKTPQPAPPAAATHHLVEITVTVELQAHMPATVWARARALMELFQSTPESTLQVQDEFGTALSWRARYAGSSLPEAIRRGQGKVEFTFTATESAQDQGIAMTLDAMDGTTPLYIPRVSAWNMAVAVARPDEYSPHRERVASIVNFSARTLHADPLLPAADRASALLAEAARLEALSGAQARLTFAGFDRIVQIESFRAAPSDGWEWLDIEAQARFQTLPGHTEAEASFTDDTQEDPTTGEIRTTVAGTVRAPDQATADAKIDSILAAYRQGRRVAGIQRKHARYNGHDTRISGSPSSLWTSAEFSIELRASSPERRFSLKIDDRSGPEGRTLLYSGTAHAASIEALQDTIQHAAAGKHPVLLRQELSMDFATDDTGTSHLISGSFSYEYAAPIGRIFGSLTLATTRSRFTEWQSTLSGSISAPTPAQARSLARSFIPAGVILRNDEETENQTLSAPTPAEGQAASPTTHTASLTFAYAWGISHSSAAMQYEDSSQADYTRMTETREISGTCHAPTKEIARTQVTALITAIMGSNARPLRRNFSDSHEREIILPPATPNTRDRWLAFRFSYSFETSVADTLGHDIIEATFSLHRAGQVDHIPIAEIPLHKPIIQRSGGSESAPIGFGYNIGRLTASGSIKARLQSTARTWGQAKRASAATYQDPSGGFHYGAEDPPDERTAVTYIPFNGADAAFYEFSFTYAFRYADGLTGLWPSSGLTI